MKRLFIAGIALLTVPTVLLAQKEKEEKDKKEKKDFQQIIITRTGETNGKTVIEIEGDKVKVNGKDAKEDKDVSVNVNTMKGANVYHLNNGGQGWNFNFDSNNNDILFSEDSNRAMLGVTTETDDDGAEIRTVTTGSGAEKAGLKKGDIITKIDDKKIEEADDVTKAVRAHKPGEKIALTFLRDGKEQKATAELGKWKGIQMSTIATPRFDVGQFRAMTPPEAPLTYGGSTFYFGGRPRLGLSIQDTEDGKGVKVLEVDEESNAAKAGIQKDDIILSVDDKEIKGTDDVSKTIRDAKDKFTFNFKVQRGGKVQNIEVKMPRKLKTTDL